MEKKKINLTFKVLHLTEVWEMNLKQGVQVSPAFSVVARAASGGPDVGQGFASGDVWTSV